MCKYTIIHYRQNLVKPIEAPPPKATQDRLKVDGAAAKHDCTDGKRLMANVNAKASAIG